MSTEAVPSRVTADGTPLVRRLGAGHAPLIGAVLSAAVATSVVLSGVRGSGHRLVRDFVAVPVPAAPESVLPSTASALRAWPLDALDVGCLVGAADRRRSRSCSSCSACCSRVWVPASSCGGPVPPPRSRRRGSPIWNPYVTERLLLGQVPTLLGYACLPWIVLVGRSGLSTGRRLALLVVVAAPAAVTPWGGVVALAAAVLVELSRPDRTPLRVLLVAALGVVWCSPWLVPALLVGGVPADPDGAAAFALADDSGLGAWASALMGGGVWASGAQPLSRTDPVALTASLVLLALALGGVAVLAARSVTRGVVASLALVGPASLAWWASGPGLDALTALQQVPGLALLRDQHRMLAPSVMAAAVLVGVAVGWVGRHGGGTASALVGALVVALSVASVPDLPRVLHTAYRPVAYPAEWAAVVDAVGSGDGTPDGALAALAAAASPGAGPATRPSSTHCPGRCPAPTLVSTALSVERDGAVVVVDDSPTDEAWATGEVSGASLRRHGVTHVVEWLGTPGALPTGHDGWLLVHSGADFRVWDVAAAQ